MKMHDAIPDKAYIRQDGRGMRPYYLFEAKSPAEIKGPCDCCKLVREIAPEDAARPLIEGHCPLVK